MRPWRTALLGLALGLAAVRLAESIYELRKNPDLSTFGKIVQVFKNFFTMEKYSKTQEDKNAIKTKKSSVASKSKELMIRHTSSKKNNNVSIMTKEASQLNDDIKKKMKFNENTEKGIFRPKSNGN
jgi:hypothetical protein